MQIHFSIEINSALDKISVVRTRILAYCLMVCPAVVSALVMAYRCSSLDHTVRNK